MSLVTDRDKVDTTDRGDGQQKSYLILSEEERAKGFVRPVRKSYFHVGIAGPKHPLRDLTEEEQAYNEGSAPDDAFLKFETYPVGSNGLGRLWTKKQLDSIGKGCGALTKMADPLAETYARNPQFYGGTFCVGCKKHLPVGEDGEFTWEDGSRVGT